MNGPRLALVEELLRLGWRGTSFFAAQDRGLIKSRFKRACRLGRCEVELMGRRGEPASLFQRCRPSHAASKGSDAIHSILASREVPCKTRQSEQVALHSSTSMVQQSGVSMKDKTLTLKSVVCRPWVSKVVAEDPLKFTHLFGQVYRVTGSEAEPSDSVSIALRTCC